LGEEELSEFNKRRNNNGQMAEALLGMVSSRAARTLSSSTTTTGQGGRDPFAGRNMDNERNQAISVGVGRFESIENDTAEVIDAAFTRAASNAAAENQNSKEPQMPTKKRPSNGSYLQNPSVYPTALAHSLWRGVIRPNEDTIIDATCGNGKDALELSSMLFSSANGDEDEGDGDTITPPELICIDIQQQACQNTLQSLQSNLHPDLMKHVSVYHTSHAPLPQPKSKDSVGLICYNLGYLPGSDDKEAFNTQMVTTIYSLADSVLLLRTGGLLSVMTYPGSSLLEATAVRFFCEGLAMFTSREGWTDFVDSIPSDQIIEESNCGMGHQMSDDQGSTFAVKDVVKTSLKRVFEEGEQKQTWRVFDHRPLGRPLSPVLVTATRIK
jgi:hypothetical protein